MEHLYVVLGDVVDSRNIGDQASFQRRLQRACETINERCERDVYAEFSVLKGIDEVGGVLDSAASTYDVARELNDVLHPERIRMAVAFGRVTVGLASRDVSQMGGPAFNRASDTLGDIEEMGLLFSLSGVQEPLDSTVTDVINLLLTIRGDWTDRQREVVRAYERFGTQTEAASHLGVTQQAVSRSLRQASWQIVETIEHRLRSTLEGYDQ